MLDPVTGPVIWLAACVARRKGLGHYRLALGYAVGVVLEYDRLGLPFHHKLDRVDMRDGRAVHEAMGAELGEQKRGAVSATLNPRVNLKTHLAYPHQRGGQVESRVQVAPDRE